MAHCCVVFCANDARYKDRENGKILHFHRFPTDCLRKKQWLAAIRRDEGPNFKVTSKTFVCAAHFTADDYSSLAFHINPRLKPTAVPSVFQWSTAARKRKPPAERWTPTQLSTKRVKQSAVENSEITASVSSPEELGTVNEDVNDGAASPSCSTQSLDLQRVDATEGVASTICKTSSSTDHDYADKPMAIEEMLVAANKRIEELENRIVTADIERFGLERFSTNPQTIRFYTGFPSYASLSKFFEAFVPLAINMKTWTQMQRSASCNNLRNLPSKLLPIDQFLMFLHKLRVGSLDQELADKFRVHQSTVSRNTITWANFLYFVLGSQPLWPSRQQVQQYMPVGFKKLFPNTRVVIDCTEIAVQAPSSLVLRSELFSSYKSRTTLKCLIGVTPAGAVSFVSSLHAGSISDKHITQVSGILDLLESGDTVMADKGFLIEDMLEKINCSLVMPNFLAKKVQFSEEEAKHNKLVSNLRVHVERANRRFKEYHLFDSPIPLNLAGSVNQLWTVACLLTNFQGPLIVSNFRE